MTLIELTNEHKLTAALHEHGSQVELLRHQTNLDLRIFAGYITLQLALGSWLSANPVRTTSARVGLAAIDLALAALAGLILWRSFVRRGQVVGVVRRLNEVLGYTTPGVYLADRAIHEPNRFVPWFPFYVGGIILGALGIGFILCQPA